MQQEEEVVTLPGIRERMALFKKAGKKIVDEISNTKQQEQRRVGKLDPKKADVKSFVSTTGSDPNALKKPKFNVQSGMRSTSDLQLDDMEISESDLAEAGNMVKGRYKKGSNGSSSALSFTPAAPNTAAGRYCSSKERGGVALPRFGRTYSLGGEPMEKPQKVKDKEEATAMETINALLQKELGDDKIALSFPSIRVRYLTAMGALRPDYYDSSDSIRNLMDAGAVRKRLAEKRKIEAARKRRYDKVKGAWEDYEEAAQDKPTELTEQDAEIERDLDEIEADIAQEWQEFTEDVIRVFEEQAEADTDAALSDDDQVGGGGGGDRGRGGEDSDVERWRQEAKRLKADAAARRKRREAHLRHRQARKLKAKNDLEGARAIQAQAEVNMKQARTLRDEARKEVITIDVDALEIVLDEEELFLGDSQLSFTEVSEDNDGLGDEKKEDTSCDSSANQADEDDDDDNKASGTKSKSPRGSNRAMRPGVTRGHSFDDDEEDDEPQQEQDDDRPKSKPKPKERSGNGTSRGMRPGVTSKEKGGENSDNDSEDDESSEDGNISSKKKHEKKSKSKQDNASDIDIVEAPKTKVRMERRASMASTTSCSSDEDNTPKAQVSRQPRRASMFGSLQSSLHAAVEPVPGKKKATKKVAAVVKATIDSEEQSLTKKMKGSKGKNQDSDSESNLDDSKASLTGKANKSKSKASVLDKKEEAFDTYPQKNLDGSDWINPFKGWSNKPKKTKIEGARISIKVPEKTDNWRKTRHNFIMHNAPFYWHKVSGSFQVMVKVTGDLGQMYDKAGLMIRLDDENWIMTGMEYYNNQMNHSTCVTHDYTDWSLSPLPASAAKDGAWFCLKRIGDSYEVFYSLDGNNWVQTRQGLFNDAQSIQVGIFCACPMGESYKVSFDMYRCKNLFE
jgi:uncharacterized protein